MNTNLVLSNSALGAHITPEGTRFCVYSRHCTALELLLFNSVDASAPTSVIPLNLISTNEVYLWQATVPGLQPGQIYGFRAHGPFTPHLGQRFDASQVLLDPYGRAVAIPKSYDRHNYQPFMNNSSAAMKTVLTGPSTYNWAGDQPLRRAYEETVIYELHVKGFTQHPSSGLSADERGTYQGLIAKIPYLLDLGITAIELLPVFQYDESSAPPGLRNYWGYEPVAFFAPHLGYSQSRDSLQVLDEFRAMVHACHRAGIEVILDVVYNHTSEGDQRGPTFCFRGLDNLSYYLLDSHHQYANFTGTGNTLNVNHPLVRRLILDSLCYWVQEMHIDGFRFDLAAVFMRNEQGILQEPSPLLHDIGTDSRLEHTKLIAEPWDAAGLYQLGHFPEHWREWNGKFRDDVRRFVNGSPGSVRKFAARFFASADIYGSSQQDRVRSINFITCHDGFTLADLVAYNQKHNFANGEHNRDGMQDNFSWNCGIEGPSNNPVVEALRLRQSKNFLVIQILAFGVPMLLMGDEIRRSQYGNNNAYCQDNPISWMDWTMLAKHQNLYRFVRELIRLRHQLRRWSIDALTIHEWHGINLHQPDWGHHSHSIALTLKGLQQWLHIVINAYWKDLNFALPPLSDQVWHKIINTSLQSPNDITIPGQTIAAASFYAPARSIAVFLTTIKSDS